MLYKINSMSTEMLKILISSSCKDGKINDFDRKIIYQKAQQLGISQQQAEEMINQALSTQNSEHEDLESGFISIDDNKTTETKNNQEQVNVSQQVTTNETSKFTDVKPLSLQGAMSIVSQAKQYGKWIIIKRIKPEYKNDNKYRDLFMREFENAYHLDHPHIIRLLDKGEDSEGLYYTMEYVDGRPLTQLITESGIKNDQLAEKILRQTLDALSYVHKKQIVHRDLKPDNIYVTFKGDNVKILDFGLASADNFEDYMQKVGTPKYAAPEQMQKGFAADQRADIFSVGKIFLEMLTGKIDEQSVNKIENNTYKHIIEKATAQNPNDRFNDCEEIIGVLNNPQKIENIQKQKKQEQKQTIKKEDKPAGSKKSPLPIIIIAVVVIALLVGSYFLFFYKKDGKTPIIGKKEKNELINKADSLYNAGIWDKAFELYNKIEKKDDNVNNKITELKPAIDKFNEAMKVFESNNIARSANLFKQISQEFPKFSDANKKFNECKNIIKKANFEDLKPVKDASTDKYGMTDGKYIVVDYQFDKIRTDYYMAYKIGLIPVINDNKYGFIAKNKEIVPCRFNSAPTVFADSRFYTVDSEGKKYKVAIDENGAPVIEGD